MFTGIIVAITVILLWFTSYRLYKAKKIIQKEKVEWLALSAFMAGFGIFLYGIRSLFIDVPAVDTFMYRLGITLHLGLSFIPAALFIYRNFINSKNLQKVLSWLTVVGSLFFAYGCAIPPLKRMVSQAPFEPFPMRMSNFPWVDALWKNVFVWFAICVSLALIWTVFYYSVKRKQAVQSLVHRNLGLFLLTPLSLVIFSMPFAAMQPWYGEWKNIFTYFYIAISLVLIFTINYYVEKNKINISLYYGLGVAYLLFPAMLCIFCTPIFARLLYVPGAILLFLALRKEIRAIEQGVGREPSEPAKF